MRGGCDEDLVRGVNGGRMGSGGCQEGAETARTWGLVGCRDEGQDSG